MQRLVFVVGSCVSLLTVSAASGQQQEIKPQTLTTKRGRTIHITFYDSPSGKESPVVVLLHGPGGNRKKWDPIAKRLQKRGYATIAVDLTKHGDSVEESDAPVSRSKSRNELKATDYLLMVTDDLEAVKKFIYDRHQDQRLNMRKLMIVGVDATAAVAVNFAGNDWLKKPHPDGPTLQSRTPRGQDVQGLVLISPRMKVKGLKTNNAMRVVKAGGVSFQVVAGTRDSLKRKAAEKLFEQLKSGTSKEKEKRMFYHGFPLKQSGDDLIAAEQAGVLQLLLQFGDKRVKTRDTPWRDRRSRLSR